MQSDLEFAVDFVTTAGRQVVSLRATSYRWKKFDRTDVTDADRAINDAFIIAVRRREDSRTSIRGEERSSIVAGASRLWVIDPIDGTGEYVNDQIPDGNRTSCIGISLFVDGELVLSVVHNPFRGETFAAEAGRPSLLNGRRITCSTETLRRGMPYDYCYWGGVRLDVRRLEGTLGKPLSVYSAIYQACMVASGRSAFAIFPGDTIHDIAPGMLLVEQAGGIVTDLNGRSLDWGDLSHGVLYANRASHTAVLRAIVGLK